MAFDNIYIVVDTETGGLVAGKNPMIEIAMVVMDQNLNIIHEYSSMIGKYGVNMEIQDQALKANGITRDQIAKAPPSEKVLEEVISTMKLYKRGRNKPILVGHNLDSFDWPMLDDWFYQHKKKLLDYVEQKTEDTMWWARLCWGIDKDMNNYKNGTCCEKAGVELIGAHRALSDTKATAQLFRYFIQNLRGIGAKQKEEIRFRHTFKF